MFAHEFARATVIKIMHMNMSAWSRRFSKRYNRDLEDFHDPTSANRTS